MTPELDDTNQVIQGLWIGEELSTMEQLSIASFLANGHAYHLYAYEPIRNVPAGAELKDAAEILPRSRAFQYTGHATWSGFANFFRYKLLLDRGGWWADTDLICLQPFCFQSEYVFSSEFSLGRQMVNIGAIKAPPGSDVMRYAWEVCQTKDTSRLVWGETGPQLMEEAVLRHSLERSVLDWRTFCPVGFRDWKDLINPDADTDYDTSYAIHLWHEMWRAAGQDTNIHYHPGCTYERMRRRYLGANDRIAVSTVERLLRSME
jgi:hypothetical protein